MAVTSGYSAAPQCAGQHHLGPVTMGVRASLAGRRKQATQTVRFRPFASKLGHNLNRGPAPLVGVHSGATHHVLWCGKFGSHISQAIHSHDLLWPHEAHGLKPWPQNIQAMDCLAYVGAPWSKKSTLMIFHGQIWPHRPQALKGLATDDPASGLLGHINARSCPLASGPTQTLRKFGRRTRRTAGVPRTGSPVRSDTRGHADALRRPAGDALTPQRQHTRWTLKGEHDPWRRSWSGSHGLLQSTSSSPGCYCTTGSGAQIACSINSGLTSISVSFAWGTWRRLGISSSIVPSPSKFGHLLLPGLAANPWHPMSSRTSRRSHEHGDTS
jgi:hypothetical protein